MAGPLIQKKALQQALNRGLAFEVGRPNEAVCTRIGNSRNTWAPPTPPVRPLRVALFGCGVVGGGVYQTLQRYPERFEVAHVVVRESARYPNIDRLTTDTAVALDAAVDVVIVCFGGVTLACSLIAESLDAGKCVVTANKAAVAAYGRTLAAYTRNETRKFWYSAAVGGALPALETLATLRSGCGRFAESLMVPAEQSLTLGRKVTRVKRPFFMHRPMDSQNRIHGGTCRAATLRTSSHC